jgi:hypothetical protein
MQDEGSQRRSIRSLMLRAAPSIAKMDTNNALVTSLNNCDNTKPKLAAQTLNFGDEAHGYKHRTN